MVKCEFSETHFSFYFMFEYIKILYPMDIFPVFPNTVVEGREGGGFDVKIGINLFFQFKIPKYYTGKYHARKEKWNVFKHPYYSIEIQTGCEQFRLLKELKKQDNDNHVYYIAPVFNLQDEMYTNYKNNTIVQNSAWFAIENFPEYESDYHELCYAQACDYGYLFSTPHKLPKTKKVNPLDFLQNVRERKSLFAHARIIRSLLKENEIKDTLVSDNQNISLFVKQIHSILLFDYNIIWLPITSSADIVLL